jgi:hypothetical protein
MKAMTYKCHTCRAPVTKRMSIARETKAAAISLSIIINLRLARSTNTPTRGVKMIIAAVKATPIHVSGVAFPPLAS